MRALVLIHRWLGIALCLLVAMWFASGMVMHFVPFPDLSETERVGGLSALDLVSFAIPPSEALTLIGKRDTHRLRLAAPAGLPVYIGTRQDGVIAVLDARNGRKLTAGSALALASARAHARARGMDATYTRLIETGMYDQWSVPGSFNAHRPLHRVALGDVAGTELYVSSTTGEVVLDTSRYERGWNWVGSVAHWIYPTVLRQRSSVWNSTVWWLSLLALIGALTGTALGVLRLNGLRSPFRGWMHWHHVLGLTCAVFVLTWIFSGWLSMDQGQLFSDGKPTSEERARVQGPALAATDLAGWDNLKPPLKEIEWFAFAGETMARVIEPSGNRYLLVGTQRHPWLTSAEINNAARLLAPSCAQATVATADDAYTARSVADDAPMYRIVCGENWFYVDGANGRIIKKLDASSRAYRWAYQALHTLDFPFLAERETLRTPLIVVLCTMGLIFSLTGVVIGWRRLKLTLRYT